MSYTLTHTAESIDRKLNLIAENKNLLPYPYEYSSMLPAGLTSVGDGSFLTTAAGSVAQLTFSTALLTGGKKYILSLDIRNIKEEQVVASDLYIVASSTSITTVDTQSNGVGIIDLTGKANTSVSVRITGSFEKDWLIRPQIEEAKEGNTIPTEWVPNMDQIGTYVDRRFNGTNAKIKVLDDKIEDVREDITNNIASELDNLRDDLDSLQLLDTSIKLDTELKTYYNVGKITNASGTNPITIGNAGDSLRDVFNRLFNMDEVQPSITQPPSVSCSFSSDASDERGTTISSISYSITFNDGAYTNASSTGVSMTSYSFSNGTASSTTATSGTLTLPSTYTVGTSPAFSATLTAIHSQGNIAKTNLGNNSNPTVRISSGSKTATPSFSKSAIDYPYFASSTSASVSVAAGSKSKKETALTTSTGASCTYGNGAYVWIFVRKGSATSQATKTIETYSEIAKAWGTLLGGTEKMGEVTFNKANGVSDTFYAYRTKNAAREGATFTIRLK